MSRTPSADPRGASPPTWWPCSPTGRTSRWSTSGAWPVASPVGTGPSLAAYAADIDKVARACRGQTAAALRTIRVELGLGETMDVLDGSRDEPDRSTHHDDLLALESVAAFHPEPATFASWLQEVLEPAPGRRTGRPALHRAPDQGAGVGEGRRLRGVVRSLPPSPGARHRRGATDPPRCPHPGPGPGGGPGRRRFPILLPRGAGGERAQAGGARAGSRRPAGGAKRRPEGVEGAKGDGSGGPDGAGRRDRRHARSDRRAS